MNRNKPGVVFTMRYPDDAGYVWNTIAQSRDIAASYLTQASCFIAYPKLTGNGGYAPINLNQVELDFYDYSADGLARIIAFIKTNNIKSVVFMSALPSVINLKALRKLGVRTINTENDSFDHRKRDSFPIKVIKFVVRKIFRQQLHDLHLANAESQRTFLRRYAMIPDSRLDLVRDGIDCNKFTLGDRQAARTQLGLKRDSFLIICVAQARAEKRLEFIIKAAKRIVDERAGKEIEFIYVGDGPPVSEWKILVHELGLADRFTFAGRQSNIAPYYQAANLMVHAAERESFGLAIVEGMACGLPIVASAAAGPKETILNGNTGRLIEISDFDGFVDAILQYIDDERLTMEHGLNAHDHVKRTYSIDRQGEEIAKRISNLLGIARY